jgi:hypothetical protein
VARGFGSTKGAGTTDSIEIPFSSHATLRSYSFWSFRNGNGGGGFGGTMNKQVSGAEIERIFFNTPVYWYTRKWTGSAGGQWFINPAPSAGAWHQNVITYNAGSIGNKPVWYVDGVSKTVTTQVSASGSVSSNSDNYVLGNRKTDNARVWDGMIAEFGIWDRILTAQDAVALAAGWSPLALRQGLKAYVPLVGDTEDRLNGATTVTGTAVQPHVRSIYLAPLFTPRGIVSAADDAIVIVAGL